MSISAITTGSQTVTSTGPVTATTGLAISGVSGDCTVHVRVQGLSAASGTPQANIQLEDSVNGFTAVVANKVIEVQGTIVSAAEQHYIFRKYELPTVRFGTSNAVLRANVTVLNGTTPSLTMDAWLEQ